MKQLSRMVNDSFKYIRSGISSLVARVSTASKTGKTVNVRSYSDGELRDIRVMEPYGISSSIPDDMIVQVVVGGKQCAVVGAYDTDRPDTEPGEVVVYTKFGSRIEMRKDGGMTLVTKSHSLDVDAIWSHINQ